LYFLLDINKRKSTGQRKRRRTARTLLSMLHPHNPGYNHTYQCQNIEQHAHT
jgi:hypothetical protein